MKNQDFCVLDNETDVLTIFAVNNRLKIREKEIVGWVNKKKGINDIHTDEEGEHDE